MASVLDEFGVSVVAISPDSPESASAHRRRDGLTMTLLRDPELALIRRFGAVHRRGLVHSTFTVMGIPLGFPVGFRDLAIPTALLVDEAGIIRWIDQATDYRRRGDAT
jgi:alkyl hydroperoxide reductase subunit AhpC